MKEDYDKALDCWSIGCILAELLKAKSGRVDRGALFPGTSCFPLSPDVSIKQSRGVVPNAEKDQLNMIFDIIGTPTPEDLASVPDARLVAYLRSFPPQAPKDLTEMFPNSPPEAIDLLSKFLVFNPAKRFKLDEAI
jgi:mitogen-activated protein kinase 1/3